MKTMLSGKAAKAWVGGGIAALACLAPAAADGLQLGECLTAAGAFLVGFQGVYWTTNREEP